MKRILSLLLLAALLISFTACSGNVDKDPEPTGKPTAEPEVTTEPVTETPTTEAATTEEPTTEEPTTDEPEKEKFVYKHVVIIGIDGMGAYHTQETANTPNLDSIFKDYALTDIAQSYNPVASGPLWLSMFTGISPLKMQVLENTGKESVNKKYADAVEKYGTIFSRMHDTYPDANIASITGYAPMQDIILDNMNYMYKLRGYREWWSTSENTKKAVSYLKQLDTSKPSLTFIYYIEPDSTGHKETWGSEKFHEALTECDVGLGEIFKVCEEKGMLEDTLFIVATDHGGDGTKHGGIYTAPALNITLGFRGKTVNNTKNFNMILRDIAPIVVEAMGLEPCPDWATLNEPPAVPKELFKE